MAEAGEQGRSQGRSMMGLIEELFPICRSVTGDGLRRSLAIIGRDLPMVIHEVPSGTPVLDWTVPREWNIRAARISRLDGTKIVDFADNNLHIVHYSHAVDTVLPLAELKPHLHTLPRSPDHIPYRTGYYAGSWGFCLSQRTLDAMTDPAYRVTIDATLEDGSLSYGEAVIPGRETEEVLFSCHCCHPSLANDNLAGIAVARALALHLLGMESRPRLTYRFLFIPGTIGALTWLARNEAIPPRIRHGLVLSCLGDSGNLTYKRSRREDAPIDRIAAYVLEQSGEPHTLLPFSPYGYDERQYCSPGFDLPVGRLTRSPNGGYPEYHSSADDLAFIRPDRLEHSLESLKRIVAIIEGDRVYRSLNPKGEPQLGRRGLYRAIGGANGTVNELALLWVLNLADGRHSLFDMALRSGIPFPRLRAAADALLAAALLEEIPAESKT